MRLLLVIALTLFAYAAVAGVMLRLAGSDPLMVLR